MSLSPEQMARRSRGLGASDAASAVGLNPYKSAVELWQEKRGEVVAFEGNEATLWGRLLEPIVRQQYAERTKRVVRLPVETLVHPVHDFLLCHPDGVTDDLRLYEGKVTRFGEDWGDEEAEQVIVPEHHYIQVQHGLMVTGLDVADLVVLIGGQVFRIYPIDADKDLHEKLIVAEAEFWQHVIAGTRPAIDYSAPGTMDLLKKLYPGTNGKTVLATPELIVWRAALDAASADEKEAKAGKEEAKSHLLDYMGEASILKFPDGRSLRRKTIERKGYVVEPTSYIDARFVNS